MWVQMWSSVLRCWKSEAKTSQKWRSPFNLLYLRRQVSVAGEISHGNGLGQLVCSETFKNSNIFIFWSQKGEILANPAQIWQIWEYLTQIAESGLSLEILWTQVDNFELNVFMLPRNTIFGSRNRHLLHSVPYLCCLAWNIENFKTSLEPSLRRDSESYEITRENSTCSKKSNRDTNNSVLFLSFVIVRITLLLRVGVLGSLGCGLKLFDKPHTLAIRQTKNMGSCYNRWIQLSQFNVNIRSTTPPLLLQIDSVGNQ